MAVATTAPRRPPRARPCGRCRSRARRRGLRSQRRTRVSPGHDLPSLRTPGRAARAVASGHGQHERALRPAPDGQVRLDRRRGHRARDRMRCRAERHPGWRVRRFRHGMRRPARRATRAGDRERRRDRGPGLLAVRACELPLRSARAPARRLPRHRGTDAGGGVSDACVDRARRGPRRDRRAAPVAVVCLERR